MNIRTKQAPMTQMDVVKWITEKNPYVSYSRSDDNLPCLIIEHGTLLIIPSNCAIVDSTLTVQGEDWSIPITGLTNIRITTEEPTMESILRSILYFNDSITCCQYSKDSLPKLIVKKNSTLLLPPGCSYSEKLGISYRALSEEVWNIPVEEKGNFWFFKKAVKNFLDTY